MPMNMEVPLSMHVLLAVFIFILSIAIAYACLKLYDEPVRECLKRRFLEKKGKTMAKSIFFLSLAH